MRNPGGLIRATPLAPTAIAASGMWTLSEAQQARAQSLWPLTFTRTNTDQVPAMSAATTSGVTVSGSVDAGGSYSPWRAFDDNTGDAAYYDTGSGQSPPWWVKVDFGSGNDKAINEYRIKSQSGALDGYCARDWLFQWSDDNSSWTTIDTQSSQTFSGGNEKTYLVTNGYAHRYWRIYITANTNAVTELVIGQLQFML